MTVQRRPEYEYKEQTFSVGKGVHPETVLAKARDWIFAQTSKAQVEVTDENGNVVARRSRSADGHLTPWELKGEARYWKLPEDKKSVN